MPEILGSQHAGMRAGSGIEGQTRWWLSGGAALLVHGAVAFVAPRSPEPARRPELAHAVWLTPASESPEAPVATSGSALPTRSVASRVVHAIKSKRAFKRAARVHDSAPAPAPTNVAAHGASATLDERSHSEAPGAVVAELPETLVPVRAPGLLTSASPCRGYFPVQAKVDRGAVHIHVHVDEVGRARMSTLLHEWPNGHGFGSAARACAATLRFAPALNSQGVAVTGVAKLELVFDRS